MEKLPLITVIIPTYNYGKYIIEAIESVQASDYPQDFIEIIVVDDGSTDNTAALVQNHCASNLIYIHIDNSKKVGAVKLGVDLASGKYIFNLDADDLFQPDKIIKVVTVFEQNPNIVHVSHINNYWDVSTGNTILEKIPSYLLDRKIEGNDALTYLYIRRLAFGAGSTYAGRADVIKEKLIFSDDIGTIVDEYLAIATMSAGYSYFIGQPLTLYRVHSDSDSNTSDKDEHHLILHHTIFSKWVDAVETQIQKSDFITREFKHLYKFKSKEYRMYCKKIQGKDSILDAINFFLYFTSLFQYFGFNTFLIFISYDLIKYLIPSFIFTFTRKKLKSFKGLKTSVQK